MTRQPKYPHVPKRREPLYPHRPLAKATGGSPGNLLDAQPLFVGKGYRVDIENWGVPDKATAGDVARFEEEELGNRLGVPPALVKELDRYHHSDVIWVTKKREDAKHYLSEGMTEADISEIDVGAGARIIADDGGGGYLVLRGGAQPNPPGYAPMAGPKEREGRCYELAWKHIAYQDEGTMVHGQVWSEVLGRMIDHAWVITETGYVYEPVSDLYFEKDDMYPKYKMQEISTYTPTEARKMALGMKHFGPWTDDDKRKVLGEGPGAAPMFDRERHQYGDERKVFYIQYWSPKSDPENSQPYYHSGPEEDGTYKDLNQALRAASELRRARADAFDISIYSRVETWVAEEEDPRYGYWEPVDETVKGYDMKGALVYDETA